VEAFEEALAFVLRWEGDDTFTHDPQDPGGATKYGISYRFIHDLPLRISDVDGDGLKTWRDVQALELHHAQQIYKDFFWTPLLCDVLPERVAFVLFDTAVNCGRTRAVKWLQQLVSSKRDGIIGPKTLANTLRLICPDAMWESETIICTALVTLRDLHYMSLAHNHEWAERFVQGWRNRTDDLLNETTMVSV